MPYIVPRTQYTLRRIHSTTCTMYSSHPTQKPGTIYINKNTSISLLPLASSSLGTEVEILHSAVNQLFFTLSTYLSLSPLSLSTMSSSFHIPMLISFSLSHSLIYLSLYISLSKFLHTHPHIFLSISPYPHSPFPYILSSPLFSSLRSPPRPIFTSP